MIIKRNILGLGQTWQRSVLCLLSALALCLASCKTASQFPLDDAYYRPESSTQTTQSTPIIQNTPSTPTTPKMEVLHQQDTTITVRIKR